MDDNTLKRRDNESELDYHRRLLYGKLDTKTIDADFSELSSYLYGKEYSSDVARRMAYGSFRTLQLIENSQMSSISDYDIANRIDDDIVALRAEKQKMFDQRTALNKLIRERSRQEELNSILDNAVRAGDLPTLQYTYHVMSPSDNDMLVSLNDLHYGAEVHNYWNDYDSASCKDMLRTYLDRIITIGKKHESERCIVWANGDFISGNIHYSVAVTNKENVIEQIVGVSELIAEFLAELSNCFDQVIFTSVAGNHSRLNPNKDYALSSERLDDLVPWYLKARLQDFSNVVIDGGQKVDETMYLIDIRGKTYCGVHGDYDLDNKTVQSLQTMAGKPIYAVLSGHMHHNKTDEVQGVKTVMAGSFIGMDDYCVRKRIVGKAEQIVCICNDAGIECVYDVPLK